MIRRSHLRAGSLAMVAVLTATLGLASEARGQAVNFQRLAGPDRYATAAAVSRAMYPSGVPVVYIARGDRFPDALAAGPAAAANGGPVLIVRPDQLPSVIADELSRLAPQRIVVVGGESAITPRMFEILADYHTGGGITRVGGTDRYDTAARVSAATFAVGAPVYIATGEAFPDALAGGAAAARDGAAMLLTRHADLPEPTRIELDRLRPSRIVVLGGPAAVDDAVAAELAAYTGGDVARVAGNDRYETVIAMARTFEAPAAAFLATGRNFPDALAAIAPAARLGAPLLLTEGIFVPMRDDVEATFGALAPGSVYVVGGGAVVQNSVVLEVQAGIEGVPSLPSCTYEDILTPLTSTRNWNATLVDTRLAVPSDYVPPNLVTTANAGLNGGYQIRSLVIPDLADLASAARANGTPVEVVSAYRSYETQADLFDYWVSIGGREQALRTSARAGHSQHQLGTTLDFTSLGGSAPWNYADWAATPAGAWMAANAWRYGFLMTYTPGDSDVTCYDYEPWHYRYVGRELARVVTESGVTLREWLWAQGYGLN